ncbi:hypothetical protein [uncultured Sphingomonas sp.]|uniref:hypothetical protein n=1 Tax=uncultured Sphingomonas sp. TaxID=158754 RepID=UPI0035CAF2AB
MTRGRRGWAIFAALLPLTVINLVNVARQHADVAAAWPIWRPMVIQLTLVLAGAVLVAALAFGVQAWRKGADA